MCLGKYMIGLVYCIFFFKQKTAYEVRISDWSSDVCSSDLRHLLSGLLTCGACGGSYAILVKDRYGCSNHYRRGACTNGHTIRREEIEARVLEGLKHKLVAPEAAADAIRAFQEETNRLNREIGRAHV